MKYLLIIILLLPACSPSFPIGKGVSIEKITIEPNNDKNWKGATA